MAESLLAGSLHVNAPTDLATPETCRLPPHPNSEETRFWLASNSSSSGSGIVPDTPKALRAGPDARISTVWEVEPEITNPAMRRLEPVPTNAREEIFRICVGEFEASMS